MSLFTIRQTYIIVIEGLRAAAAGAAQDRAQHEHRRDRRDDPGLRKGTNGVSTHGVSANLMFFDRDCLGTPVNLLSSSQKCQGVPFSPISRNSLLLQRPH